MKVMEPMYPFQMDAAARILHGDQVYLGFDPGLGKSRTALAAAMGRGMKRILVICPASGRYVWEEQTKRWSNYRVTIVRNIQDLRKDGVVVLTYGLISQKDSVYAATVAKDIFGFDMTVLDEAAACKNPGANRTKAILGKMLPKLGYVLPLSGTPAPNHAGELYPLLKALYPQAITGANGHPLMQWQFEDRYCRVMLKRFGMGRPVRVVEGSKNLLELRARMNGFMLRVKKEDVLKDLPPVRYDVVPIGVSNPPALAMSQSIRELSDDDLMRYLSGANDEHLMRLRHQLGLCKVEPAVEYIDDFMTNLPAGQKILVFAHHRDVIEKLNRGLQEWNPMQIVGSTSTVDRALAVKAFLENDHCRVLIGNIQAMGTGLTLVGPKCHCSNVIFVEASFSVGDNVQAAARVHRIGQREAVVARFLTAHQTFDDRVQDILARKARDFATLFN
jgi:SWI/SNF-related matrix-associated actin-dependent regulator of chromatin subfamily A-like protein 1